MNKIVIGKSNIANAGRGVFAIENIKKGELIEICPILIFSSKDAILLGKTKLQYYVYDWDEDKSILVLGFGSLYNHSQLCNSKYEIQEEDENIYFSAIKNIKKGEEITINYGSFYIKKYNQ